VCPPRKEDDERTTEMTGMAAIAASDEPTGRVFPPHRLVCVAGTELGRSYRIASPTVTIGRGPVDVPVSSKDVSRHHARIFRRTHDFAIEDLGSANGTYVNNVAVRTTSALRSGDRIQVGSSIFVFAHHDELEERMHKLQRLEAMTTLAAGLAHDFNNALAVILGGLELFEYRVPTTDPDLRLMVQEMRTAASSASSLARRLLHLGRTREPVEFEPVQLAQLVQRTVSMMRRQLPQTISVECEIAHDLVIRGSEEELHQVLINLLLNARDAMPGGGRLRIEARGLMLDRIEAAKYQLPTRGAYVEVVVSDTGVGMDESTKARVFEPFFTTKPPGQGTGLGLAMIHNIVRRHGGAVVVDSALGRGTSFTLWLAVG
jgi:signal transduction histidine kinase